MTSRARQDAGPDSAHCGPRRVHCILEAFEAPAAWLRAASTILPTAESTKSSERARNQKCAELPECLPMGRVRARLTKISSVACATECGAEDRMGMGSSSTKHAVRGWDIAGSR